MDRSRNGGQMSSRSRSPAMHASKPTIQVKMPKIDLLIVGPEGAGKTALMKAFARNEQVPQSEETDPLYKQIGMVVTSQLYHLGVRNVEQTVKLQLWDPAMREITEDDTEEASLVGINEQLRVRYQTDVRFHGMIVCYDCTNGESFTQSVALYKELVTSVADKTKLNKFSKVPVAFVGTKLDLTDFISSEQTAVQRCVQVPDLRLWLAKVHRRAENACFETSALENIGISIMVDWIVKAALKVHPVVEASRAKKVDRFSAPADASARKLSKLLGATAEIPLDEMDEEML